MGNFSALHETHYVSRRSGSSFIAQLIPSESRLKRSIYIHALWAIALASIATVGNFFVQVGAIAENGASGMWDATFVKILWQMSIGDATIFLLIGLSIALLMCSLYLLRDTRGNNWLVATKFTILQLALFTASSLLLAASFIFVGHTVELAAPFKLLLGVHVVAIAWWMGALWPLYRACHALRRNQLHILMHKFGRHASITVAFLVTSGAIIGYQLTGSLAALFGTSYGQGFVIKPFLIGGIMLLALWHKMHLVPSLLNRPKAHQMLARSITVEMLLGIAIFLTTAVITTVTGPAH